MDTPMDTPLNAPVPPTRKLGAGRGRLLPPRFVGVCMVLVGATLWGLSGTASQRLFDTYHATAPWLVDVRMGFSGLVLLTTVLATQGVRGLFAVWARPKDALALLGFAVLGLYMVQLSYLMSIARGNAAMATFLQYLGPAFVLLYAAWHARRWPTRWESAGLALAVVGTLLLVTNGSWHTVVVPPAALVWGLISAVTLAIYTVAPGRLMRVHGAPAVIGWAMLIGSVVSSLQSPPWRMAGVHPDGAFWALAAFVVILGTLVAFYLYLSSTSRISPVESSLLACVEPLSAAVASVVWLHTQLGAATVVGGLCIVGTVVVLTLQSRRAS
ncbi:MAG: DMT family transporter [Alicyclobacillus sp.]|nr:DMT family transporter [Alicyclobacillus sp.]